MQSMENYEKPEMLDFMRALLPADDAHVDDFVLQEDAMMYVNELLQSNLESLCSEEIRLNEAKKELHGKKAALVLENYAVLLDVSAQLNLITKDFPKIKERLKESLEQFVETEDMSRAFETRIAEFGQRREKLQEQSGQLHLVENLLEIPALITSLAKNGLFEEAVDLIQFIDKLTHQRSESETLRKIVDQSKKRAWMLMNLLGNHMRTSQVQLLEVLRIVSLERRLGLTLDIPVEEFVRTDFLQARSIFIKMLVQGIPQRDSFQFMTKIIEICRLHFFETVNHFLSVFPDSPELPPDLRVLPYLWIQQELDELASLLKKTLPSIDDSRLESLFNQFSNLADALSRFGANVSVSFLHIFVTHLFQLLERSLQDAVEEFRKSVSSGLVKKFHTAAKSPAVARDGENSIRPPEELMEFPQLAALCNNILAAFNRIRLCFFSNLIVPVVFAINSLLRESSSILKEADKKDVKLSEEFRDAFVRVFVPFIEKARDLLCPPQDTAAVLGVSLLQAKQLLSFKQDSLLPEHHEDLAHDHATSNGFSNGFSEEISVEDKITND